MSLTVREHMVLEVERRRWKFAGAKEQHVLEHLGWNPTRYHQVLNHLLDRPEALAADPQLVNRLRRLRDQRSRARSARRTGWST